MVKVVAKLVLILQLMAEHGAMRFAELLAATGLGRSNLSHLLKSLCDNRLLTHCGHGKYMPGEGLSSLLPSFDKKRTLFQIVNRCANNLMHELDELVVVGTRHRGERLTLCKARPPLKSHQVNGSGEQYARASWYNTATGRILLACQSDEEIRKIVEKTGLAPKNEWSEASTFDKLMGSLARIRQERAVILQVDEYVSAIGIPCADASGEESLCLSTAFLKVYRKFTDSEIIERLRHHAELMRREISFNDIVVSALEL